MHDLPLLETSRALYMEREYARQYIGLYVSILHARAAGMDIKKPQAESGVEPYLPKMVRTKGGEFLPTGQVDRWGDAETYPWEFRNGQAIIDFVGPVVRRGGWLSAYSNIASTASLARQVVDAMEHPAVTSIACYMDSGGGSPAGVPETARMIYELGQSGGKPMGLYSDNYLCSAAYYLGRAFPLIHVSSLATVGSIGCVYVATDYTEAQAKAGIKEIVIHNSQSPLKAAPASSKEGYDELQRLADENALVFAKDVAFFAGVDLETVWNDFGRGGCLLGQHAVDAGMVDALSSEEEFLDQLAAQAKSKGKFSRRVGNTQQGNNMATSNDSGVLAQIKQLLNLGGNDPAPAPVLVAPNYQDTPEFKAQQAEIQKLTSQVTELSQSSGANQRAADHKALEASLDALPPAVKETGMALINGVLDANATPAMLTAFFSAFPAALATVEITPSSSDDPGDPETPSPENAARPGVKTEPFKDPARESRDRSGVVDQKYVDKRRTQREEKRGADQSGGTSGSYRGGGRS